MTRRAGAGRWAIVALVFFAIMLNYVDRQILALLKPTLEQEFGWSDQDYGNMASAFQFAAAIAFLGTGWFIDRVGLRIGFAVGVAVWSVAGMAHAFAVFPIRHACRRIALGSVRSTGTFRVEMEQCNKCVGHALLSDNNAQSHQARTVVASTKRKVPSR